MRDGFRFPNRCFLVTAFIFPETKVCGKVLHLHPEALLRGLRLAGRLLTEAFQLGRRPEGLVDAVAGQDLGDDLPAVLVQVVCEEGEHVVLLEILHVIILQDGQEGVGDESCVVGTALEPVDLAVRGLQVRLGLVKPAAPRSLFIIP